MRALIGVLFLACGGAHGTDFNVELESLGEVPSQVARSIRKAAPESLLGYDNKPCRLIGKAYDLQDSGSAADWIVTTADACSWAASAAPIWVVRSAKGVYGVVLSFVTYDLTIGKTGENGMRNLATARGTAARVEEQLWKFDGSVYRITRNRVGKPPG